MQMYKRNKGITLVALIITIIVLLILSGVSLSFVFNGGILDKSQQAVNEYQNASQKEQDLLDQIDKYIENELGNIANDEPIVPSVDSNGLAIENTTIVAKDEPSIQIVIPKGFAPAILQTGTTQSLPGENGAVKEIMPAEEWNNITKEDINRGIVVVDHAITYDNGQTTGTVSDFNEYVWIPMPDSSKFARVAWNGPYLTDELKNGIHPLNEVSTENAYWEDKTTQDYKYMIDSVSIKKGFYISRYEASQKNAITVQSKRGQDPCISVSQLEAIELSSNMKSDINSHLIYGIEWDSVLKWLIDNEATIASETSKQTKIITQDDTQKDSSSWGNYADSVGNAKTNSGNLQNTGTSEYWKVNNIYDLVGNISELTQERYSTDTSWVARGGNYSVSGSGSPAAYRFSSNEILYSVRIQSKLLCIELTLLARTRTSKFVIVFMR